MSYSYFHLSIFATIHITQLQKTNIKSNPSKRYTQHLSGDFPPRNKSTSTMKTGPFGFTAESFLQEPPPDYEKERILVIIKMVAVFLLFAVIIPPFTATPIKNKETAEAQGGGMDSLTDEQSAINTTTTTTPKQNRKSKKASAPKMEEPLKQNEDEIVRYEINPFTIMQCCLACVFFMCWVLLKSSPDNYYTTRGVFQAPLFTREECDYILNMADVAAQKNYKEAKSLEATHIFMNDGEEVNATVKHFLLEPFGWQKRRHGLYPTTDLNLVTDPFTKADQLYIKNKLDARLSPIVQRIFGVPGSSIRANDVSYSTIYSALVFLSLFVLPHKYIFFLSYHLIDVCCSLRRGQTNKIVQPH
jgi:hypothetical protein